MPIHVAVTQSVHDRGRSVFDEASRHGLACFGAPADEAGLAAAIREHGARHAVVGTTQYREALYDALPAGGVIARFGVGIDGLDLARATARGLLCTNTPGVLETSVAEHVIALMLSAARHVPRLDAAVRAGQWCPDLGIELCGRTLAVIGCGAIGCRVASIASRGFGMRVTGCEVREVDAAALCARHGFSRIVREFGEAAADADFVSLHLPATPATRRWLDAGRLAAMPRHAWLINTARGSIVDEAALHDALSRGELGGAALDVFETEPYVPAEANPNLAALEQVILTPHVASTTADASGRMAERCIRNIRLAMDGAFKDMDLVNPDATA